MDEPRVSILVQAAQSLEKNPGANGNKRARVWQRKSGIDNERRRRKQEQNLTATSLEASNNAKNTSESLKKFGIVDNNGKHRDARIEWHSKNGELVSSHNGYGAPTNGSHKDRHHIGKNHNGIRYQINNGDELPYDVRDAKLHDIQDGPEHNYRHGVKDVRLNGDHKHTAGLNGHHNRNGAKLLVQGIKNDNFARLQKMVRSAVGPTSIGRDATRAARLSRKVLNGDRKRHLNSNMFGLSDDSSGYSSMDNSNVSSSNTEAMASGSSDPLSADGMHTHNGHGNGNGGSIRRNGNGNGRSIRRNGNGHGNGGSDTNGSTNSANTSATGLNTGTDTSTLTVTSAGPPPNHLFGFNQRPLNLRGGGRGTSGGLRGTLSSPSQLRRHDTGLHGSLKNSGPNSHLKMSTGLKGGAATVPMDARGQLQVTPIVERKDWTSHNIGILIKKVGHVPKLHDECLLHFLKTCNIETALNRTERCCACTAKIDLINFLVSNNM